MKVARIIILFLLGAFALSPWSSPPLSLLLGLAFALTLGQPFPKQTRTVSKYLLQAAVVGLGFGLDLNAVLKAGSQGILVTFFTIGATLALGYAIGRWLSVERKASLLISVGTAICGGSAIAAVGPVIRAGDEEMSVSLGTVFILNAVALLIFPLIGHWFQMSQNSFGLWAALAIHDTSSVVGATSSYGQQALEVGTTIKLTRALWIIPVSFVFAYLERRYARMHDISESLDQPKLHIPWFIGLFVLASVIRSLMPQFATVEGGIVTLAKALLSLTLFLIGAGLSRAALKKVGVRPLLTGIVLWFIVGISSLIVILRVG
jgi:uncharacterized integral membrane protein (TIGR00698 family)